MYYVNRFYKHGDPTTIFVIWEVKSSTPELSSEGIVRIVFVKKIKDDNNEFQRGDKIVIDRKRIAENSGDVLKEIFK